jgi:hypothetical protein
MSRLSSCGTSSHTDFRELYRRRIAHRPDTRLNSAADFRALYPLSNREAAWSWKRFEFPGMQTAASASFRTGSLRRFRILAAHEGLLRVSQQAMLDLQQSMKPPQDGSRSGGGVQTIGVACPFDGLDLVRESNLIDFQNGTNPRADR